MHHAPCRDPSARLAAFAGSDSSRDLHNTFEMVGIAYVLKSAKDSEIVVNHGMSQSWDTCMISFASWYVIFSGFLIRCAYLSSQSETLR